MRYYLPLVRRGVPEGARALAEYDCSRYILSIGRRVSGWVQYDRKLTGQEIERHGLLEGGAAREE